MVALIVKHTFPQATLFSQGNFKGNMGKLISLTVVNIIEGVAEEREMVTGIHTVKDISCIRCNTTLGWIYIRAHSAENKYKEGKCILERKLLVNNVC
ncbi:predicted protein [Lichtheimia corymbifera JMRC:FSU:9682]|uniref:Protein yippee-like n=1 Tax=Lichtheimia corymbifera JMRC:FSU:9682 TaxID=1263082 RepID=A0A068RT09_9FUNG|nr:predicted protein [Lichtheimia corymbifera JMRC:FSU:9682]